MRVDPGAPAGAFPRGWGCALLLSRPRGNERLDEEADGVRRSGFFVTSSHRKSHKSSPPQLLWTYL